MIDVSQVVVQVEYSIAPQVRVSEVVVQVEYGDPVKNDETKRIRRKRRNGRFRILSF